MTYTKPKLVSKTHSLDLDVPLEKAVDVLKQFLELYPNGYLNIRAKEEDGSHYVDVYVSYKEMETQAEADERGKREADYALRAKQFKRKQYEALKKEFE